MTCPTSSESMWKPYPPSLPRSFVEVVIVAVRDQAYMTDIIHRDKWLLIELSALPFNFAIWGAP